MVLALDVVSMAPPLANTAESCIINHLVHATICRATTRSLLILLAIHRQQPVVTGYVGAKDGPACLSQKWLWNFGGVLWKTVWSAPGGRCSADVRLRRLCPKPIDGAPLAVGRFPAKLGPTTDEMACLLAGLRIGLPG